MIFALDAGVLLGSTGTFIAAIVGGMALLQNSRTGHKTATKEEVQQAFDMQDKAMQELEASNGRLAAEAERMRGKYETMHSQLNDAYGKMAELKVEHRRCQIDLNALGEELRTTKAELADVRSTVTGMKAETQSD